MKKDIVSIAVISYNSEDTILETLISILNQDYGSENIELIIGDDASKDSTQKIISEWIHNFNDSFHSIRLNIQSENKGVTNNFNSTGTLATSEWIKYIAADDILMRNCISEFKKFITENKNINCVFCKIQKFNSSGSLDVLPKITYYFNLPPYEQFKNLLIDNFAPAPGAFIRLNLLQQIGFAEKNLSMEDYPMWLKLTYMNIPLAFLDQTLVKYRIGNSLSNSNEKLINLKLTIDTYKCKEKYINKLKEKRLLKALYFLDLRITQFSDNIKIKIFKNKKNFYSSKTTYLIRLLSPVYLFKKIKSRLH